MLWHLGFRSARRNRTCPIETTVEQQKGRKTFCLSCNIGIDNMFAPTIAAEDKAQALAEAIAPMLTKYGFILSMWDVVVKRWERF